MNTQDLTLLFEPDIIRMAPKYLIQWYIEEELIDISLLEDDGGIWDGYIWYN